MDVSSLLKAVTWKQTSPDSNPRPFGSSANALPLCHNSTIVVTTIKSAVFTEVPGPEVVQRCEARQSAKDPHAVSMYDGRVRMSADRTINFTSSHWRTYTRPTHRLLETKLPQLGTWALHVDVTSIDIHRVAIENSCVTATSNRPKCLRWRTTICLCSNISSWLIACNHCSASGSICSKIKKTIGT